MDEGGKYFHGAGDMAIAVMVMEQSHDKIAYLPEITYLYNINTGLNVHKHHL